MPLPYECGHRIYCYHPCGPLVEGWCTIVTVLTSGLEVENRFGVFWAPLSAFEFKGPADWEGTERAFEALEKMVE